MGNSQSSSATQYAPAGVPALQSVKPCYLSGDPDLYGLGIRLGFYFQYAAAIIVVFRGFNSGFVGWLAGFVLLATATFVSLCINSTADTLVIMDWSMVGQLIFIMPLIFAFPLYVGIQADWEAREQKWLNEAYLEQLIPTRNATISRYQEAVARTMANIVYAVELIMDDTRARQQYVKHLVERFVRAARAYDSAVRQPYEYPAEGESHIQGDSGGQLRALEPQIDTLVRHIPDGLRDLRRRVNEMGLTTHHVEALARVFPDTEHTEAEAKALGAIAREDQDTRQRIKIEAVTIIHIHDLGLVDAASAGIVLIIYAGYCSLAPWLFFIGVDRGAKQGCDVKLLFFFAPISVHNNAFAICLKVIGAIAVLIGLIAFIFGVIFLAVAVVRSFDDMAEERAKSIQAEQATQRASDDETTQPERNPTTVLAPRHGQHDPQVHFWVTQHMQEVHKWYDRYTAATKTPSKEKVLQKIGLRHYKLGFLLFLFLIYTIVVVEMTIQVNHLTLAPLSNSTGQVIALFVGGFMLLVTLYKYLLADLYRFISWFNDGHWVPELRRVRQLGGRLHRFLRAMRPTRPAVEIRDVEQTTGGRPQIVGNRIEEIGEEPLPLPAPNPV